MWPKGSGAEEGTALDAYTFLPAPQTCSECPPLHRSVDRGLPLRGFQREARVKEGVGRAL